MEAYAVLRCLQRRPPARREMEARLGAGSRRGVGRLRAVEDQRRCCRLARIAVTPHQVQPLRYGVATDRVGIVGFSAGVVTAMGLALMPDAAVRPDFAITAYGGIRAGGGPVAGGPPVFIVGANNDAEVPRLKAPTSIRNGWTPSCRQNCICTTKAAMVLACAPAICRSTIGRDYWKIGL